VQDHRELQITTEIPEDLNVLADEVELARVIVQPAGERPPLRQDADTAVTHVDIAAKGSAKTGC
jgi:two-component system osmolarity sensor histidine kinase EnvZ